VGIKKRATVSLLKKYMQLEKDHGTEATVAAIV
jgi:hypothetical protein